MREAVDKRQNRVAVKQQSLTFAGMGHIGQLMGADVQLLGQNLPVTVLRDLPEGPSHSA